MDYRLGTCSSCKSQFRVPATFTADRARCKKCAGVVLLGPVMGSGEPTASRPAPPAARPAPAPAPRAAAVPEQAPPAAKPPPRPAPPAEASTAAAASSSAARPAARAAGERKSVREAAAEAASRVQSAGAAGGRRGSGRRGSEPKKSRTAVLIGSLALLAGLIAGGWFLLGRDGASEAPTVPTAPADGEALPAPAEESDAGAEGHGAHPEEAAEELEDS